MSKGGGPQQEQKGLTAREKCVLRVMYNFNKLLEGNVSIPLLVAQKMIEGLTDPKTSEHKIGEHKIGGDNVDFSFVHECYTIRTENGSYFLKDTAAKDRINNEYFSQADIAKHQQVYVIRDKETDEVYLAPKMAMDTALRAFIEKPDEKDAGIKKPDEKDAGKAKAELFFGFSGEKLTKKYKIDGPYIDASGLIKSQQTYDSNTEKGASKGFVAGIALIACILPYPVTALLVENIHSWLFPIPVSMLIQITIISSAILIAIIEIYMMKDPNIEDLAAKGMCLFGVYGICWAVIGVLNLSHIQIPAILLIASCLVFNLVVIGITWCIGEGKSSGANQVVTRDGTDLTSKHLRQNRDHIDNKEKKGEHGRTRKNTENREENVEPSKVSTSKI